MATLYTIGHSNTPADVLLKQLRDAGIATLVDIRRFPSSRRNPQFNGAALAASLREIGIGYVHAEDLGGRRDPQPDTPNLAISNDALRGYADYTSTTEFAAATARLLGLAVREKTAVMCAEASPNGCHRSYLADALVASGNEVIHIIHGELKAHELSPTARVEGGHVTYPSLL